MSALPVIALTGGIGSGKSSVATILQELGAQVIDTDQIAHQLTAPGEAGTAAIRERFGPQYLDASGALDRRRMREQVFADPRARKELEAILHPLIRATVSDRVRAATTTARAPYVVIAVPLLIETGAYRDLASRVLVVDCSEEQQVTRVMQRSGLSADEVRTIMASQANRAQRLAHADDVIHNDADLDTLHARVVALHRQYLALAGNDRDAG